MPLPCSTKIGWLDEESAKGHLLVLLQGGSTRKPVDPTRLHVYKCPSCECWHVGHAVFPIPQERSIYRSGGRWGSRA